MGRPTPRREAPIRNPSKLLRTRTGGEVRIYEVNGGGVYPLIGAICTKDMLGLTWRTVRWTPEGKVVDGWNHTDDLVNVSQKMEVSGWVRIYKEGDAYRLGEFIHSNTPRKDGSNHKAMFT